MDWDALVNVGYRGSFGFEADLLDFTIGAEFPIEENKSQVWNAPDTLEIISGQNQRLFMNQESDTLKVKVNDSLEEGSGVPFVPVYFTSNDAQNTLNDEKVFSGLQGDARTTYTPPNGVVENITVTAEIRDRHSEPIQSVDFNIGVSNDPIVITFPPGMFPECNEFVEVEGVRMKFVPDPFDGSCYPNSGHLNGHAIFLGSEFHVDFDQLKDVSKIEISGGGAGGCDFRVELIELKDGIRYLKEFVNRRWNDPPVMFEDIGDANLIRFHACGESSIGRITFHGPG